LIKASAGGGGKKRVVENGEFESQMNRAISEALNAFGDGAVLL
jgi:propionyl-CoA carboxylase alpha chain